MYTHKKISVFSSVCATPKGTQTSEETVLCISEKIQSLVNIPGSRELFAAPTEGVSSRSLPPYQTKASCVPPRRYGSCYLIQASRQLWASSAESSKRKWPPQSDIWPCERDCAKQACLCLLATLCCRSYRNREARHVNDTPRFTAEASSGCTEFTWASTVQIHTCTSVLLSTRRRLKQAQHASLLVGTHCSLNLSGVMSVGGGVIPEEGFCFWQWLGIQRKPGLRIESSQREGSPNSYSLPSVLRQASLTRLLWWLFLVVSFTVSGIN